MKPFVHLFFAFIVLSSSQLQLPANAAVVLVDPHTVQQIEEDIFRDVLNDNNQLDEEAEMQFNVMNFGDASEGLASLSDKEGTVLVPAGWRRFRRKLRRAFRKLENVFRRVPPQAYVAVLSKH